jgi:hypothetical protein
MWKMLMAGGAILVMAWVVYFPMGVSALSRYMGIRTYYSGPEHVIPVGEELRPQCNGGSFMWGTRTLYSELRLISCNGYDPEPDPVCYVGNVVVPCPDPVCYWDGEFIACPY